MRMLILLFVLIALENQCRGNILIPVVFPRDCNSTEIYDHSQLVCRSCGDDDNDRSIRKVRKNFFECQCPLGSYMYKEESTDTSFICVACNSGSVTSQDGHECVFCRPPSAYDSKSKTCVCKQGIVVETNENGVLFQSCVPCPGFSKASSTKTTCVQCHQSFWKGNNSRCQCPSESHREEGGSCIPRPDLIPEKAGLYSINFESRTVRSKFIADNLQAASYNCHRMSNRTACQLLGNMCVLLHYSFTDSFSIDLSNACMEYRKLMTGGSQSAINYQLWPTGAPWLYYMPDARAELKKTNVPNHFGVNSQLKIVAFRYNALGHLIEVSHLEATELQMCRELSGPASIGFTFGSNFHQECTLTPLDIWTETEKSPEKTLFYDLYLLDSDGRAMYPIPILNLQLEKNEDRVNERSGDSWQLVRRFFLREAFSGDEDSESSSLKEGFKKTVRFIQYFDIDINLRETEGPGSIFPPLISISYGELTEEDIKANKPVTCTFKITYWMNQRIVERDVSISLAVLSCLGILLSMVRTWTWNKRAAKVGVDLISLAKFVVIAIGIVSNVLFVVNIVRAICWFVVFKKQDVVHTLLPTPSQEYSLWLYLIFAFPLKTIQVIHDLSIMCIADVFFIDWERPKSRALEWPHLARIRAAQSKAAVQDQTSTDSMEDKGEESVPRRGSISQIGVKSNGAVKPSSSVSVWRSLFVANEWLELFPHRRICLEVHLFLVIFVMKVWNLEELTKYDHMNSLSAGDLRRHVPSSLSCRVALGCLVYSFLIAIQAAYVAFFHERYVRDKRKDFVDFCSVSNISVFIWVHERYGYYIHGRSPNGRAEVNMKEMHDLLKREEEDLCSRRGLLPNTDQQTFEMTLPISMYDQYQQLRSVVTALTTRPTRAQNNIGRFLNSREEDVEKRAPAYFTMTKFLSGFIDHTLKDFDYIVRDKTTMEALLDAEFDEERRDLGYFYNGQ